MTGSSSRPNEKKEMPEYKVKMLYLAMFEFERELYIEYVYAIDHYLQTTGLHFPFVRSTVLGILVFFKCISY